MPVAVAVPSRICCTSTLSVPSIETGSKGPPLPLLFLRVVQAPSRLVHSNPSSFEAFHFFGCPVESAAIKWCEKTATIWRAAAPWFPVFKSLMIASSSMFKPSSAFFFLVFYWVFFFVLVSSQQQRCDEYYQFGPCFWLNRDWLPLTNTLISLNFLLSCPDFSCHLLDMSQ